ncbi:hypothetical protein C6A37_07040 [Desulfobacteraceae bacterium SEEP-SAG9]|nr:hypothetical protein C6A37_07040 [Desulfobacteraceae bacterium SEEP-SAG9]
MKFKNIILSLRNHPYYTGAIIIYIILIGVFSYLPDRWAALSALGTISVIIWAVYRESILAFFKCPVLELSLFESKPPHIIKIPEINRETKKMDATGYYVTLKLLNTGRSVAKDAQAMITGRAYFQHADGWQIQPGWMPLPINWVLDEWTRMSGKGPTEERDLIPERAYLFHAVGVSSVQSNQLLIYPTLSPNSQVPKYVTGEHCFEITVFAIGAKTIKKYVYVNFKKDENDNHLEIPKRLKVSLLDDWPFPH